MKKMRTFEEKILIFLGENGQMSLRQIQRGLKVSRYASLLEAKKRLMRRLFLKEVRNEAIHAKGGKQKILWLTRQGLGNSILKGADPHKVLKFAKQYRDDPFSIMFLELSISNYQEIMRILQAGINPENVLSVMKDVRALLPNLIESFKKHPDIWDYAKENNHPELYDLKEILMWLK
jgi:hypothetical protein